jgi:hypothetical protein
MYQPFVFKLEQGKNSILEKSDNNLILSTTINLPLISLGFHYFLHRTKNAMSITKNLQTSNNFYNIVNPFEITIPNYEDSINNLAKHYINKSIESKTFYKLWEIIFSFNICEQEKLNYTVIGDEADIIVDVVKKYRQKLGNKKMVEKEHIIPNQINNFSIKQLNENLNKIKKTDLLIADCTLKWENENYQEQESYKLILGEIITALSLEADNVVLKIFETFTIPTIKLIYILSSFYDETHIYKPCFSKATNSEKYIICKGFKKSKSLKSLENIFDKIKPEKYVFDIFPDLELSSDYINKFKIINIKIANPQQIMINEIIKYIKENNYFGEKYHTFREKQIESTKWWVNNFFPPSNNLYEKNKEDVKKQLKLVEEKNNLISL